MVLPTEWPACTMQGCGTDSFGPYHGPNCARSKFAAENLSLFWD